jgi:hypothetical protein
VAQSPRNAAITASETPPNDHHKARVFVGNDKALMPGCGGRIRFAFYEEAGLPVFSLRRCDLYGVGSSRGGEKARERAFR